MNNIAFPKLGISLNISPVAFSIGSKPIYWYTLFTRFINEKQSQKKTRKNDKCIPIKKL